MAKQSAPIQEVSRLLDLVPYLSTHSYISLKELADEFGVSEKEMANELTALSMCGLPGYTPYELIEIFFDSGFVTINNHDALDIPRALTNIEVATLLIGLQLLRETISIEEADLQAAIDRLIAQLRNLTGDLVKVEDRTDLAIINLIEQAISQRSILTIEYLSSVRDELSQRTIEPLTVYSKDGHLYLDALSHPLKEFRTFRVDRITSAKIESIAARPTEVPQRTEVESSVTFKVEQARRLTAELLSLQTIPSHGEISIPVFSQEWALKATIAHAPDLAIIEPRGLREMTRERLENILALYSS